MDPQFEELAHRLKSELAGVVAEKLDAAEQRLTARVDRAEDEFKRHSTTHMESLEETVKLAAESYGATLEHIERRLDHLHSRE